MVGRGYFVMCVCVVCQGGILFSDDNVFTLGIRKGEDTPSQIVIQFHLILKYILLKE